MAEEKYWQYEGNGSKPKELDSAPTNSGYYYKTTYDDSGNCNGVTLYDPSGKVVETKGSLHDLSYIANKDGKKYETKWDGNNLDLNPDKPLNEPNLGTPTE
uniref:hypothetical protein n=1 Tax=Nocardia vinacea TaxID=96468 RepID=UPI0012F687E6